jgi:hypothetical protein
MMMPRSHTGNASNLRWPVGGQEVGRGQLEGAEEVVTIWAESVVLRGVAKRSRLNVF